MTWREEAKELGIAVYDKKLKRPRKKLDVLRDIELKKAEVTNEAMRIIISPRDATEICKKALYEYVSAMGMKDAYCEKWFLNCKRKGIVFKGTKNVREEDDGTRASEGTESESEGTGSDVSGVVRESERASNPERPEEVGAVQQLSCPAG